MLMAWPLVSGKPCGVVANLHGCRNLKALLVLKVWAASRMKRSRAHRALHGNIKVARANVSGLSKLHLALLRTLLW